MKKTYQNPITSELGVELQDLIASSLTIGFGDDVTDATGAESRSSSSLWEQSNIWDTKEYDEEY